MSSDAPNPAPTVAAKPPPWRVMLDAVPARALMIDRRHHIVYLNQEALDFLHARREQVVGRHLRDIIGRAYDDIYRSMHDRIFDGGETVRQEGWIDYPGVGRRYVQEHFLPYRGESAAADAPVEAVFVFVRDLTELKQREAELSARVAELQTTETLKAAIVDHALAAIISTDAQGHIVEFNPAAEAMFGQPRAAVLGRSVGEVIVPNRHRHAHQEGMRRMEAGEPPRVMGRRLEMSALRASGEEFPVEMVLWRTEVAGQAFYTASLSDLTERRTAAQEIARQREALRQSEKLTAMGSLLAGVAHELNNPLAIVMGRASLLEDKTEGTPMAEDAHRIREAAERCGRIVRTFLNMARQRPAERVPLALNDLVRGAADLLQYSLRTGGITLELSLAHDLPPILADGDRLGQVVLNLIVNAQQALSTSPAPRLLRVATGIEAQRPNRPVRVWLRVSDNGPGVPPELHERIFDPYFTTKRDSAGTGLGLAVSRAVAHEHGGELRLEPGTAGASFRLSLPIGGDAPPAAPPPAVAPAEPPAVARVLVVDDEPEIADLMRAMLERAGYEVATAESGAVALELLGTASFDAIVSDLRMPDMDGAALWRAVRDRSPKLARRMMFVTGDTLSPGAQRFLEEAHCSSLDKPFSKADLLQRVKALLQGRSND